MSSPSSSVPSSVASQPNEPPPSHRDGAPAPSTTRILRSVVASLRPLGPGRGALRWHDPRAAWLELPRGWTRGQVNDLVIAVPGATPGGTTLLLVVEPVRVVASGSIEDDLARAAAAPGLWSPGGSPPWRETSDGWTHLVASGELALASTVCPSLVGVARRNALRARFWAVADSVDTRERFRSAVLDAVASVRRFVEGAVGTAD